MIYSSDSYYSSIRMIYSSDSYYSSIRIIYLLEIIPLLVRYDIYGKFNQ